MEIKEPTSSLLMQYSDLNDFLSKHSAKNDSGGPTHTRIPDKSLNIYGGAYAIPKEELGIFHAIYYNEVFNKKRLEYLTEKQLQNDQSPILLDFDFRYNYDVETRQHTKEHITDLLAEVYLDELKKFFIFTEDKPFQIFVMEKPDVIRLKEKSVTKDGIHIIIGIQMNPIMQQMLREKVLERIAEMWEGLPIVNGYESVMDEGISKGTTNWQMYGSRKPGNLAYELTHIYNVTVDPSDNEFMFNEQRIEDDYMTAENFSKLSAQYTGHPSYEINPRIKAEYEKLAELKKPRMKKSVSKTKITLLQEDDPDEFIEIKDIHSAEILDKAIQYMLTHLNSDEYKLKEVHNYTQILPASYYESGSHEKNRLVAFALKNTDERLFLSWIKLRSKASDFDYGEIMELKSKWDKYFNKSDKNNSDSSNSLTYKSILYWARQDAYQEFMKIKEQTIDHFIDATILEPTEWDFAMILYHMFKDKYICTSITNKTWYVFNNHYWEQDKGDRLRYSISREMYALYKNKRDSILAEASAYESNDPKKEALSKKVDKVTTILGKLKKTSDKNNIFREAHEIFYDKYFNEKMDSNKYLMCFSNGVVDFKNKVFRDGHPQDYITKTTKIPYTDFETLESCPENKSTIQNILDFMEQLFPNKSLNKYMWQHLSSVLIGENMNQTFNIYVGSGSNGKSILMDLMAQTLGEYKGTVPITLVTDKRNSIGGTSSEVMQLKGVRYAVMQEPSKNAKINEGVMKELTGGDPIQARGLYKESEIFIPQFSLAVCTNTMFDITSNDNGTWRRIRKIDYTSVFVDELPSEEDADPELKYFLKDKTLKEKMPFWAPIFASMLVKMAYEHQGKVDDCDVVMASSNKYRNGQDYIAAFVSDRIVKETGKRVKKTEVNEEFRLWFTTTLGSRNVPKCSELHEYLDKKFSMCKDSTWSGIKIVYPSENVSIIDVLAQTKTD